MADDGRTLAAARYYVAHGLRVVPVPAGEKGPKIAGWQNLALEDDQLERYFSNGANIGVLNGTASGDLHNVDLDATEAIIAADYLLPATGMIGGRASRPAAHRYYRATPPLATKQYRDVDGTMLLELRSTGTQTLVEPSVHPSGEPYKWRELGEAESVEPGILSAYCARCAAASILARHWPGVGARHDCALALAGALCRQTAWDDETIWQFLMAVCAAAGDGETTDRLETVASTRRRLASGETATGVPSLVAHIGPLVVDRLGDWLAWRTPAAPSGIDSLNDQADKTGRSGKARTPRPTDDEMATRWAADHPNTAYGLGEWRRYRAGLWPAIPTARVERELADVLIAAKGEGVRPSGSLLGSVERIGRVLATVEDGHWDADAGLLICQNGALELATGSLRPHSPDDYATSGVPYDHDPLAVAPTWTWFLERSAPDAADFLQEFAGYCLTTDTALETAVWLHGPPGSGKSTFLEGLQAMLGKRAGVLGLADIERSRFALAGLPGKTLIIASEQPATFIQSAHILNALISGESVVIERKFKDAYNLIPRAKLCWAMNELPRVSNANSGLFRRVKVVDFPALPLEQRDPAVKETIKTEGAGILNWARAGLARLMERQRFVIPRGVEEATAHFVETNDLPALFVADRCEVGRDYQEGAGRLYQQYVFWCQDSGHKPMSMTRIAEDWKRLGFESERKSAGVVWSGVRLKAGDDGR